MTVRFRHWKLKSGEKVGVYVDGSRVILQVRRLVHGADDPVAASFKSGVVMQPEEAMQVGSELLAFVAKYCRPAAALPPGPARPHSAGGGNAAAAGAA